MSKLRQYNIMIIIIMYTCRGMRFIVACIIGFISLYYDHVFEHCFIFAGKDNVQKFHSIRVMGIVSKILFHKVLR